MHQLLLGRLFLGLFFIAYFMLSTPSCTAETAPLNSIQDKLAALEAFSGGRIGVSALNLGNNEHIQYRAKERFPLCSTAKIMGVAAILKQSMQDIHFLEQKAIYTQRNLVTHSPMTSLHVNDGMTIATLCGAAIALNDNTAIKLLTKKLGGPEAVTAFARSIGDDDFKLNHWEPELKTISGDFNDTTTPQAMAISLQRLVLGEVLSFPQRNLLQVWLKANTTGENRIRAGVPQHWIVGDKTGTGDYGTTNDIGIIWPPNCPPIVVAIYFTQNQKNAVPREEIIASATRLLMHEFVQRDQCIKPMDLISELLTVRRVPA